MRRRGSSPAGSPCPLVAGWGRTMGRTRNGLATGIRAGRCSVGVGGSEHADRHRGRRRPELATRGGGRRGRDRLRRGGRHRRDERLRGHRRSSARCASGRPVPSSPSRTASRRPSSSGLTSGATESGEAIGPSDLAIGPDGTIWFLIGGPGGGESARSVTASADAAAALGQLYRVGEDGKPVSVADLAAYETANNPDAQQPGNTEPDSNANGLAVGAEGAAVADAGANSLLLVAPDGSISVGAVFPVVFQPAPPDPTASPDPAASPMMIPMDPTPTSVVDGSGWCAVRGPADRVPVPGGRRLGLPRGAGRGADHLCQRLHERDGHRVRGRRHAVRPRDRPRQPARGGRGRPASRWPVEGAGRRWDP